MAKHHCTTRDEQLIWQHQTEIKKRILYWEAWHVTLDLTGCFMQPKATFMLLWKQVSWKRASGLKTLEIYRNFAGKETLEIRPRSGRNEASFSRSLLPHGFWPRHRCTILDQKNQLSTIKPIRKATALNIYSIGNCYLLQCVCFVMCSPYLWSFRVKLCHTLKPVALHFYFNNIDSEISEMLRIC